MLVTNVILGHTLGSKAIGDSAETALIEFGSGVNEDHYNASAVSDALFMLSPVVTPDAAPAC
jgi:hypothetical protein